jgi:hypothetical protein
MPNFHRQGEEHFTYTLSLGRDFYLHPGRGFHGIRMGRIVAKELESLGTKAAMEVKND